MRLTLKNKIILGVSAFAVSVGSLSASDNQENAGVTVARNSSTHVLAMKDLNRNYSKPNSLKPNEPFDANSAPTFTSPSFQTLPAEQFPSLQEGEKLITALHGRTKEIEDLQLRLNEAQEERSRLTLNRMQILFMAQQDGGKDEGAYKKYEKSLEENATAWRACEERESELNEQLVAKKAENLKSLNQLLEILPTVHKQFSAIGEVQNGLYQQRLKDIRIQAEQTQEQALGKLKAKLKGANEGALEDLKRRHEEELKQREQKHQEKLVAERVMITKATRDSMQRLHDKAMEELKAKHEQELNSLREQHHEDIQGEVKKLTAEQQAAYDKEVKAVHKKHQDDMRDVRQQHREEIQAEIAKLLAEKVTSHKNDVSLLQQQHQDEIQLMREKLHQESQAEIDQLTASHEASLKLKEQEHEKALQELQAKLDTFHAQNLQEQLEKLSRIHEEQQTAKAAVSITEFEARMAKALTEKSVALKAEMEEEAGHLRDAAAQANLALQERLVALQALQVLFDEAKTSLASYAAKVQTLEEKVTSQGQAIQVLTEENQQKQQQVIALSTAKGALEISVRELTARAVSVEQQLSNQQAQNLQTVQTLQAQVGGLKTRNDELQNQLATAQQASLQANNQAQVLQQQINTLSATNGSLQVQVRDLTTQKAQNDTQIASLKTQHQQVMQQLVAEVGTLRASNAQLQSTINAAQPGANQLAQFQTTTITPQAWSSLPVNLKNMYAFNGSGYVFVKK